MMVLVCLTFAYFCMLFITMCISGAVFLCCVPVVNISAKKCTKNGFMHISDNIYWIYKWACLSCESIDLCRCDTEVDFCLFVSHFVFFFYFFLETLNGI